MANGKKVCLIESVKATIDEVTLREGKKRKVDRAQITEIIGHLSEMVQEGKYADGNLEAMLRTNGERRKKKFGYKKK